MDSDNTQPDFELLADWIDGRLSAAESERLAVQVAANPEARATADWLRGLASARRHAALATPPARAHAAALRALRARAETTEPGLLRRLVAALQPGPRLAGIRGVNADIRRLTFAAEGHDVIIDIERRRADNLFELRGQLFATNDAATRATAQLLRDGLEHGLTDADDFGEFAFSALPAGSYTVVLRAARIEIETMPIVLAG